MIRRLIRWGLYLFIVVVVLLVAAVLLLNTLARQLLESRLRARTGLDPRIGAVDIGLLSPTITIQNVKIYNNADFGGSLFLDLPELHVEYDPAALRSGKLHFRLVRLDLAELSLVEDKKGRMNTQHLDKKSKDARSAQRQSPNAGLTFTGIDTLNLTLGRFHTLNMATGRAEDIDFGIKDQITHNVKTFADVPTLNFLLGTRSNNATNDPLGLGAILQSVTVR